MTHQQISKLVILAPTLFFAVLLPLIQGTQLYVLFDMLNPILLIMPVVMGSLLGFFIGLFRYKMLLHIDELEKTQTALTEQVSLQTQELQEKNDKLEKILLLDPLTGLGNRLQLKKTLEFESQRIGVEYKELSIMMIDIDYFKKYNDFYGHLHGDEVLKSLGVFFKSKILDENIVIRFGGEEFIIILPDCNKESSIVIAEELVNGVLGLNLEHKESEVSDKVTISMGIHTTSKIDITNSQSIYIRYADEALYLAKEQGRNRFVSS